MKTRVLLILMFAAVLCLPRAVIAQVIYSEVSDKPTLPPSLLAMVPPTRKFRLYVPDSYSHKTPHPLVVMLHGCNQTADSFAAGTGMDAIANRENFLVLYPNERDSAYLPARCWAWSDAVTQNGQGETSLIVKMIRKVQSKLRVDPSRIYVAGLSAGGAMASILASCHPDIFAAAAIHSGVEYKASTMGEALWTLRSGQPLNPDTAGALAYKCLEKEKPRPKDLMPVVVFHGMQDAAVDQKHAHMVISQFIQLNDFIDDGINNDSIKEYNPLIDQKHPNGNRFAYTISDYKYPNQAPQRTLLLRLFLIQNMGHAWSGGQPRQNDHFYDPRGPNASEEAWKFFKIHTR